MDTFAIEEGSGGGQDPFSRVGAGRRRISVLTIHGTNKYTDQFLIPWTCKAADTYRNTDRFTSSGCNRRRLRLGRWRRGRSGSSCVAGTVVPPVQRRGRCGGRGGGCRL